MLYFVATPIGNMEEITLRALDVLKTSDVIAAEDTRHTALLLSRYGINTRTVSYHKFNEKSVTPYILGLVEEGKSVAVVSDAGMPAVSDPGHVLIDEAIARGIEFTVISGACAAINAVVLSGLSTRAFTVLGFLPEKNIDRARFIEPYAAVPSTLVFYSAVHDIKKDLAFLFDALGPRRYAVCREMTKLYETVTRGTLGDGAEITEKGEFVIVVEGSVADFSHLSIEEHLRKTVARGAQLREAVKIVAAERHVAKSEVYKVAERIKAETA